MPSERVTLQELVENGLIDTVPHYYLVSEEDRVKLEDPSCDAFELPVVDWDGVEGDRQCLLVQQIRSACEEWGVDLDVTNNKAMSGKKQSTYFDHCRGFQRT